MGLTEEPRRPAAGLTSSVQEFCRTSTAHGLGHLPDGSGRARFAWLLIVLVLMVALSYNIGTSLYREAVIQPVKSENTWHMSLEPLPLPLTTICDLAVFRRTRLDARNVSDELASYLASSLGGADFTATEFVQDTDRQARLRDEYESLLRPGEGYAELIDSLSPSCEEMFGECYLSDKTVPGAQCCRTLITTVHTVRGKCFQVADALQVGDGKMSGSSFLLSLPREEFPTLDRTIVAGCLNTRLGAEVLLDDPSRLPHIRAVSHSVAMSPPAAVELRVTQATIDRTGLRDSVFPARHHCASANGSRPVESMDNCPVLHLAAAVRTVCGCHWLSMPQDPDADPPATTCSPDQVFSCVLPLQKRMPPNDCPPACLEHSYRPAVIPAELSAVMQDMMGEGLHIPDGGRLSLRVYLESLQYQLVRQWCQTGSELLGELGGHMGLFLGVSVVTICEALAALGGCMGGACCRRRRLGDSGDDAGGGGSGGGQDWHYSKDKWQLGDAAQRQAWLRKEQTLSTFSITIKRGGTQQPSAGGIPN